MLFQKKRSISASLHAGDRDRTFLCPVNIDGKESGGLAYYFEPSSEPSLAYALDMNNKLFPLLIFFLFTNNRKINGYFDLLHHKFFYK